MQKEKAVEKIKSFLDRDDWKYKFDENSKIFNFEVNIENVLGIVSMHIFVKDTFFVVYARVNSVAEKENFEKIAEFLHRANYGLVNGNFELDYRDGEIRYKSYVNFHGCDISDDVIKDSIYACASMINKYGKGILKLMMGIGTSEECINECEKTLQKD